MSPEIHAPNGRTSCASARPTHGGHAAADHRGRRRAARDVGPARTTITAVAERAGVQRHTVYRHFPTEEDLFAACSAHFYAGHPAPDPGVWRAIADPAERLARASTSSTRYYEGTEAM